MEWVETTGESIDIASEKALELLGVGETDAEIDVLNDVKMGLFGRIRTEARVRARIKPATPRHRDDRSGKRRRGRDVKRKTGGDGQEMPANPPSTPKGDVLAVEKPQRRRSESEEIHQQDEMTTPNTQEGRNTMTEETVVSGSGVGQENQITAFADVSLEEQEVVALRVVQGVLDSLEIAGEVTSSIKGGETLEISVNGEGLGVLVGPKGAALSALQELTRAAVLRQTGARRARVVLDVGGYRARRAEALAEFTNRVVVDVLEAGTEIALEPMSASDRKVVHDTVNLLDGVSTRSEGEEPRRRVVISPNSQS